MWKTYSVVKTRSLEISQIVFSLGETSYVRLYYDVVFSDEGPGVTYVYTKANPKFPGFQENQLHLDVYNNEELEFSNVYKQTSIYFGKKVCPVPVQFENW